MVFTRSWRGNTNYRRKRKFYRRKSKYNYQKSNVAYRALSLARKALLQSKAELFNTDTYATNITASLTTPNRFLLSGIANGTDENQRSGDTVILKDLYVRIVINQHASNSSTMTRLIIFIDKQSNGAMPALTDLIQTATSVLNPLNRDYRDRFIILTDKMIYTNNVNYTTIGLKIYKKINIKEIFKGTSDAITSIESNPVLMWFWPDTNTNTPNISFYSRMRYTDN